MKVLLVYHGAALGPSQSIFRALASVDDVTLRVLGPRRGYNRLRQRTLELPRLDNAEYDLIPGEVFRAGQDFSGPYLFGLEREILRFRPDVIHIFNEAASPVHLQALVYRRILRPRAKVLFYGFENILPAPTPRSREARRWQFVVANSDGGVYANQEGIKRLVQLGYPADKLWNTGWGIPLERFFPDRNDELRRHLGWEDRFVVGFIGRFVPEKGLLTLLEAMRELPSDVACVLVGSGPDEPVVRTTIERFGLEGRVRIVDRVEDSAVPGLMNAFDALVLPSSTTAVWMEQFGRVLPEAMACGVPAIGSDSGSIAEVIGDAGLVFPERDGRALADSIREIRDSPDLRADLAARGLRRARDYSCQALAQRLAGTYRRILRA